MLFIIRDPYDRPGNDAHKKDEPSLKRDGMSKENGRGGTQNEDEKMTVLLLILTPSPCFPDVAAPQMLDGSKRKRKGRRREGRRAVCGLSVCLVKLTQPVPA